jgi:cysteine-rich repeat protein
VEDIFATTGTAKKLILVGNPPYCGDKIVQPHLGEECDDGNEDNTDDCTGILSQHTHITTSSLFSSS